ncbi:DUF6779 domain-containing protein [Candidatus Blastococcus massiliensis]|uniref:DUF6779 domain-containing protein n=1 Tax=Candidatus Blastococcus massiliensis TaxID=1470358 RepID=UPI0004B65C12|nr:DUF6779 domain-containing protein [Candidatus Blastococcus massiliensis]
MPRREDDAAAAGSALPGMRIVPVAAGFLLAAGATLAVFLTDNPQLLRLAVVAVAWAFVLATFAVGRRSGDRAAAAAREAQLRRVYEHELDLEVAARREYELELENELRRETEEAMRDELDALRGELSALADLRDQVAGVAALRDDVAALSALRDEVARVAALREDIAALGSLRHELGQLHELRDDMGRLRAELTEQLSSEMLVERIVMRTQASRLPGDAGRLDAPPRTVEGVTWDEDPPRELTGGWPAVRLDEPGDTRHFEQVRVERTESRPVPPEPEPRPWETHTSASWTPSAPATSMFAGPQPSRLGPPPSTASSPPTQAPAEPSPAGPPPAPATTSFPLAPPPEPAPSPLDWLASRSLLDAPQPPEALPPVPPRPSPRRRRGDEPVLPPVPVAQAPTTQQPRVAPGRPVPAPPVAAPPAAGPVTSPGSEKRLSEILAENGVTPPSGGRRRRRYREDGDADDVLARVLGQG